MVEYCPALQLTHDDAPCVDQCPALHCIAVGDDDPVFGQAYPALQLLHGEPMVEYCPALQLLQYDAPSLDHVPASHCTSVAVVDPTPGQ